MPIEGPGGPNLTGPAGGRNGLSAVRGIEFNYVLAGLEVAGSTFNKVAVRYKGNGTYFRSRNALKRSLKVDLNEFVKGQKLAGVGKLNFHSNVSDPTWMLEPLSYRLYRDGGVPAPRTAYCRVYVTVPGDYQKKYVGLYSLVENVDRHFAEETFGVKEGAIFKPVGPNLFDYLGDDWSKYKQQYDPKTELTAAQAKRMMDFCKLISSSPEKDFLARIDDFVDVEEFARFMAITVCLSSLDSILAMSQNFYVYLHPKSNKFLFIPWDLDNSFGKFRMTGTQDQREQLSIQHPWVGENELLERMFKLVKFQKLYRARLQEFSRGIFKPERINKQVDELATVLRPAIREESLQKLAIFDKALEGQSVSPDIDQVWQGPGGGAGGRMFTPIKPIKPFVTLRARSIADQLEGRSEGAIISGRRRLGGGG
jgi:spore coat protein H